MESFIYGKLVPGDIVPIFQRDLLLAKDMAVKDLVLRTELNSLANKTLALNEAGVVDANTTFKYFIGTIIAGFSVHLVNSTPDGRLKEFYDELAGRLLSILMQATYSRRDYKVFVHKLKHEDRDRYLQHITASCLDTCITVIIQVADRMLGCSTTEGT